MKKILGIIISLILLIACAGQQYPIYATPAGTIKTLPNGQAVKANAGGVSGQIQYNNAGIAGGFTASGDLTVNTTSGVVTLANNVVTNAKAAQMAASTIKGNSTSLASNASDLSVTEVKTLLAFTASDIVGLGTIASQNANAVNISGGAINGANVTGLSPPTSASDATNKAYVDSVATGITPRTACLVATTVDITLSGEQTIDGILTSASRVLVKNQTLTKNNGIYTSAAGAWSRTSDSDTAGELLYGYYYFVSSGTTQGSTSWIITTAPTVLGTDPLVFSQFSASQSYASGTGLNLAGNIFSINSAQSGLNLTSSTFNGTIGATTPSTAVITALSATTSVGLTSAAGSGFNLTYQSSGLNRWALSKRNGSESGSNAGADFGIFAYDDAGSLIDQPINITRASGGAMTVIRPAIFSGGINSSVIGATAPAAGTFTTLALNSNANIRTTKANLHLVVNVKDYGAVGDGTTDDRAAINSAISAISSHGGLYFPTGKYRITGALTTFSSLSYIIVYGDSAEIYNDSGASGANTLVFDTTCSHIAVRDLSFTGTATVRGSGIHVRLGASHSIISNCFFQGCSDFAVLASYGSGNWITDVKVSNCTSYNTLGDGFHFGSVTDSGIYNCTAISTGDDGLGIIADYVAYPPTRIEVIGFQSYQAGNPAGGGTHGCGIRIDEAIDVHVVGGSAYQPAESGLLTSRNASTTAYNTRIKIDSYKVTYPMQVAGQLGGISLAFCNQVELKSCRSENPVSASCFSFLDCNDLSVIGCTAQSPALRGFATDDGTTTNVASNWSNWIFLSNVVNGAPTNEAYYITPSSTRTITNLILSGNTEIGAPAGNYIFTNRLSGAAKINNNTSMEGRTIANGGSGLAPTLVNNN